MKIMHLLKGICPIQREEILAAKVKRSLSAYEMYDMRNKQTLPE